MATKDILLLAGCLIPCVFLIYTDLKYYRLPDKITYLIILAGLMAAVYNNTLYSSLMGALFGFGVLLLAGMISLAVNGASGVGGGDIKLAAGLGMWFGFVPNLTGGIMLLILASGIVGIIFKLARNRSARDRFIFFFRGLLLWKLAGIKAVPKEEQEVPAHAVPYGVFMAATAWGMWLLEKINF